MTHPMGTSPATDRHEYYRRISGYNLAPLWEKLSGLVTTEPTTRALPAIWKYDRDTRPLLIEAGQLITAKEAERRVLVLENPHMAGESRITNSLYAGLQLILPGEIAPAHRHTQNALRFVLEGQGAHTSVEGERLPMYPGDLVITPSWQWHDHGNMTGTPMVWVDALDIPVVSFFSASFAEKAVLEEQQLTRREGDSAVRYGSNMLPVDWRPGGLSSPVLSYPYRVTRECLTVLSANGQPDPRHGYKLRYSNPASGGHVTPTLAAFLQLLPSGFSGAPYQSTDGAVFVALEGTGEVQVGTEVFRWQPRDVFVIPGWFKYSIRANEESVLFSFSDRACQESLGLWREAVPV